MGPAEMNGPRRDAPAGPGGSPYGREQWLYGRADTPWPRCRPEGDNGTVGRLIAVVLFIAVLVPGVLLARAWWLAAGRRHVASAGVELAEPTPEGTATLRRQAQHGRRFRRLGLLLGLAGIVGSVLMFAEASVFLWVPALVIGLLIGVLLAEATRPRPRWAIATPVRRPRQRELISGWL